MWYLENDDFDEFLLRAKLFKYVGHDAYWRKTVKISRVMNLSFFFNFAQPFLFQQWSRQNFSLQYRYNNKKTSDENKKKYQLGDYQSSTKFSEITSREVYGAWRIVRRITIEIWEWKETDPFNLESIFII